VLTCCYAYEQETLQRMVMQMLQQMIFIVCSEIYCLICEKTSHIDSNDNGNSVQETIEPMARTRAGRSY
jgi:hypothetical protein